MQNIKPLKKFGQNYLKDKNILTKIVNEISPQSDDNLIEIGPGLGSLTELLSEEISSFTAVEIDTRVITELSQNFPNVDFIQNNFLKVDLNNLYKRKNKKLRIVGNIPYNLTSPIIFKLFEYNHLIEDSVLMVQHEVAQRMVAKQNSKDYGILSVLLKYFTETKFCFKVSPNVFYPKPKVYSAVVHLYFKELQFTHDEKELFISVVKAAFGNRRKTLKNSLSNSIFKNINFFNSGIDLSLRAEQLGINDFVILARFADENNGQTFLNKIDSHK